MGCRISKTSEVKDVTLRKPNPKEKQDEDMDVVLAFPTK